MIDFDALVLVPCMATFGEDLKPLYTRAAGGAAFAVDGIFDDAFMALVLSADGEPEIATIEPVLGVRLAQFSGVAPVQSDKVVIPRLGITYMVTSVEPDGKGWVFLKLSRFAP